MRRAAFLLSLVVTTLGGTQARAAPDMNEPCYGPTETLTPELRQGFVADVSPLAVKAEADHGVPAPILAAMSINESGYGTTQLAIASHNVLSYKWNGRQGPDGRELFTLACQPAADQGNVYVVFRDRADSADYVAGRLAASRYYSKATKDYTNAVARGADREAAAKAWLRAIAPSYNPYQTDRYVAAILRAADDPIGQSGRRVEPSLWRLAPAAAGGAAGPGKVAAAFPTQTADISAAAAAVASAQKAAYVISNSTNGCPLASADLHGWPAARLRTCEYAEGPTGSRLQGYAVLLAIEPETIARWIQTSCAEKLAGDAACFRTVLACGKSNSGMMFPVSGNVMENMGGGAFRNYFFRNGMTVRMKGQANATTVGIDLATQIRLANADATEIESIPTGLTRFWRTLPQQFASAMTGEAIPRGVKTTADGQRWLEIARTEMLAALGGPRNRLLDAWVAAHRQTLARGNCPGDGDP